MVHNSHFLPKAEFTNHVEPDSRLLVVFSSVYTTHVDWGRARSRMRKVTHRGARLMKIDGPQYPPFHSTALNALQISIRRFFNLVQFPIIPSN